MALPTASLSRSSLNNMVYVYVAPELTTTEYSVTSRQNSGTDIFAFAMVIYQVVFPEINVNNFVSPFKYLEALKKKALH